MTGYFSGLRRQVDDALTFDDLDKARRLIAQGLLCARQEESLGELMYFRAQAAIVQGLFPEAVDLLERALLVNPSDGAAYNDIALCMVEMGRIEGVMEIFDRGIAVEPDYATIRHNKGWLLNQLGQPTEALLCFEQALFLEPGRAVTWENMASAYEAQGRCCDALDAYKKALAFIPDSAFRIREQIGQEIQRLEKECYGFSGS